MNSKITQLQPLSLTSGSRFRWVAVTALLLAAGAIIKLVTPSIAGITPNWLISMYCLSIFLSRPTAKQSLVIGVAAGMMGLALSKSLFPLANLLSEPVGAFVAWLLVRIPLGIRTKSFQLDLRPGVSTFLATIASGSTFVIIMKIAVNIPDSLMMLLLLTIVPLVAVINSIFAQIMYFPAKQLFSRMTGEIDKQASQFRGKQVEKVEVTPAERKDEGVRVDQFTYSYEGKRIVLEDISFYVPKGSFTVIAGPAGSGKSTLAAGLSGLIPHVYGGVGSGRILIRGQENRETNLSERSKSVSLVMEDVSSQLVAMTVGEEVAFALENRNTPEKELRAAVQDALVRVGLNGLENRPVGHLSGGQRQRLAIAAALAQHTPIIVLDEPASALDPEGREELYRLLGKLHKENKPLLTLIVLETDITQAIQVAEQLVILDQGKILTAKPVEEALVDLGASPLSKSLLPRLLQIRQKLTQAGFSGLTAFNNQDLATEIREGLEQGGRMND